MAGDFSRTLFDPARHYAGVLMQQGRVQLDVDWNEQLAIQQHRTKTQTNDVIGVCGTPKAEEGFLIVPAPDGDDLLIGAGRYYAGGLLCELNPVPVLITFPQGANNQGTVPNLLLDGQQLQTGQWVEINAEQKASPQLVRITNVASNSLTLTFDADISAYQNSGKVFLRRAVTYGTQPDFPHPDFTNVGSPPSPLNGEPVNLPDGTYIVFLEAWQREVNALEHSHIRETALGGPDTTERLQTVWQVKLLPATPTTIGFSALAHIPSSPPNCDTDFAAWEQYIAPMTGLMNARTVPPGSTGNPCLLPPLAGYQRLENQLYRIEIFQGAAALAQSTLVWSRENASVESTITKIDGADVYLHDLGKDDVLGFDSGQWVEIVDRDDELQGAPRFLAQIAGTPDPNEIKVTLSVSAAAYTNRPGLRLRRWDMSGPGVTATGIPITTGWIDIEDGIQVRFEEGSYKSGSYWQIPARTGTGEIEWPPNEGDTQHPIPQPPLGVKHHYCQLALLQVVGGVSAVQDCRKKFPSLTDICADDVCYKSQCDMPGVATVQEALDQLCLSNDLRFHNKHLHGWGIVCGLQVNCVEEQPDVQRRRVVVRSGYAIDCNGNDVVLSKDVEIDLLEMLPAPEEDGVWLMADYDRDGIPDLVLVKTSNTATGQVEVHIASGKSNYQTRILQTGTTFAPETDGTWLMTDYDRDGIPDLVFIKTSNTGTGQVEVHIASGKSSYQTRILETGTTFAPETDGTWLMADFDQDGIPDLVFVKTSNTGTGRVEVHIASGKSNYQTRILETGTTFDPETDGTWLMADYDRDGIPDLVFVKTTNTGTGKVEVHIASGKSNYQTRTLETGTAFVHETDGTWLMADYDRDGVPDLVLVKTTSTSGDLPEGEAHIASGKSNYQTRILETGTEYCLVLDPTVRGRFRLEPYTAPTGSSFLADTLLFEFYEHCIKNLGDFYKSQFVPSPNEANLPVGPVQKRITALINLFIQVVNPQNGSFVFLSGDQVAPTPEQEHTILKDFYDAVRNELQSKTFCAQFDRARQFPDYPYTGTGIATIFGTGFGKGFKTRLRVDPTGTRGYAFGANPTIQIYDLQNQRMDSLLDFPGGGIVQDIAFSSDGNTVYAVSNLNNQDTIFAVADVVGLQHTWRQPTTVICNIILTTLATRASTPNSLYALGVGQGVYEINLQNVSATPTPKFAVPNAFGHLVIRNDLAYATAGVPGDHFDSVVRLDLASTQAPPIPVSFTYNLVGNRGNEDDDIGVGPSGQVGVGERLYVVCAATASSNNQLLSFEATGANTSFLPPAIDLAEHTRVRLAFNPVTSFLMLTCEDSYQIKLFRSGSGLDANRYPVQVQPTAIAFAQNANLNTVYVLNYLSNTITAIPADLLDPARKLDMNVLVNYRTDAINAYVDLVGGFLQYLKDCFCDRLLVDCPECDEDDELLLACITIRDNEVYKVCNFSKRKYVKSFPTVGYWMSLIPIVPLLHKAVESFCCAALPAIFGKYNAPHATVSAAAAPAPAPSAPTMLTASVTRGAISFAQQTNFKSLVTSPMKKVPAAVSMLGDFNTEKSRPPMPPSAPNVRATDFVGQSVDDAKSKLNAGRVTVDHVAAYDPSLVGENLNRFAVAPDTLPPGSSVTLVADQRGTVRYYIPSSPAISALRTDVEATRKTLSDNQNALASALTLQDQVASLKTQLVVLQATHAQELAVRDKQITDLSTTTKQLQEQVKTVDELKTQLQTISSAIKVKPTKKPG